jgi:putative transposase
MGRRCSPAPPQRRLHSDRPGAPLRYRFAIHVAGVRRALLEAGIAGSISSVGGALHNALMESTLGLCRTELIDGQRKRTGRAEVERETAAWVRWFNTHRLHSSIGYRPTVEFEDLYRATTTTRTLEVA